MPGQSSPPDRPWAPRTEAEAGPAPPAPDPGAGGGLRPGSVVDRFVVEALLGQGGMARVWRVRHQRLGTLHALKVLDVPTAAIQARILREGRAQATLRHPHVVAVTDVIDVDGAPGLVMELVEGPTLSDLVRTQRPPLDEALRLGRQVLLAVAAAHRAGLIHRDLKLSNVLVATTPEGSQAKVADFGLVKLLHGAALGEPDGLLSTRSGLPMGTPGYMAPEQIRDASRVDARADVFALGALLYALLTGKPAFEGPNPMALFEAVYAGRHRPAREHCPELSPALDRLISRCLCVDPEARPADAGALLAAFDAAMGQGEAPPVPAAAAPTPRRAPIRPILAGVGVLLGLVALGAFLALRPEPEAPAALLTRIGREPGPALDPALTPDGGQVAFSDGQDLFLRAFGGERRVNLTAGLEPAATSPAFSPDGTRLAFSAGGALYLAGPAGEGPRWLLEPGFHPAFSPDGRRIAYTTGAEATSGDSELWLLDLANGAPRLLLRDLDPRTPTFSPDGLFVAFVGCEGGWAKPGLWVVPAAGGETRRLGAGSGFSPVWDPSGVQIWYLARQGADLAVLRLPVAAGDPRARGPAEEIALVPDAVGGSLSVAARGGRLVVAAVGDEAEGHTEAELWLLDPGP